MKQLTTELGEFWKVGLIDEGGGRQHTGNGIRALYTCYNKVVQRVPHVASPAPGRKLPPPLLKSS